MTFWRGIPLAIALYGFVAQAALEADVDCPVAERVGQEVTDPEERLRAEDWKGLERRLIGAAHPIGDRATAVAGVQHPAQVLALASLEDRVGLVEQQCRAQLLDRSEKRRVRDVRRRKCLMDN